MKVYALLMATAIGFVLMWNAMGYLFCTFVTKGVYEFSLSSDMVGPLTLVLIIHTIEMTVMENA